MDLDVGVVESQDLAGLQAMGEKATGQCRSDDDGDDRVPRGAGRVIRISAAAIA